MIKFQDKDRVVWSQRFAGVHGPGSVIAVSACQSELMPKVHITDGVVTLGALDEAEVSEPRFGIVSGPSTDWGDAWVVQFDATDEYPDGYTLHLTSHELHKVTDEEPEKPAPVDDEREDALSLLRNMGYTIIEPAPAE